VDSLYRRIADDLRREILDGTRPPGSPVPSVRELARQYGASNVTVNRALLELRDLGLIVTHQGRRSIVRPTPHVRLLHTGENYRARRATGVTTWNAEVLAQGQRPEQHIRGVARVPAPHDIAARLELDDGTPVLQRSRLLTVNGVPVELSDGYYSLDLVAGTRIELPLKITGGVHRVIEDQLGRQLVRFVEELEARPPTSEEIDVLRLESRGPVVRLLRTAYDAGGRPVEVLESVVTAEHHTFRYVIDVGPPPADDHPPAVYVGRPGGPE